MYPGYELTYTSKFSGSTCNYLRSIGHSGVVIDNCGFRCEVEVTFQGSNLASVDREGKVVLLRFNALVKETSSCIRPSAKSCENVNPPVLNLEFLTLKLTPPDEASASKLVSAFKHLGELCGAKSDIF